MWHKRPERYLSEINSFLYLKLQILFFLYFAFHNNVLHQMKGSKIYIAIVNTKWDLQTLKCSQPVNLSIALQASSVLSISSCLLLLSGSSFKILFLSQVKWYTRSLFLWPDKKRYNVSIQSIFLYIRRTKMVKVFLSF